MLVLTREDVEALLDLDALLDALADAFVDLSEGRASMPQRVASFSGHGLLGVMPAYLPSANILETKLVTLFEGNAGTAFPTHQAAIAVFDPERGSMTALMDGTYITATRTAAGSALSARLLAREDARVLAVCGTGVQAATVRKPRRSRRRSAVLPLTPSRRRCAARMSSARRLTHPIPSCGTSGSRRERT